MTLAEVIDICRVRKLGRVEKFDVWIMSDLLTKTLLPLYAKGKNAIDFSEGDNCYADPDYVPKGEIWISDYMADAYIKYIVAHELSEATDMRDNKMTYEQAHKKADQLEYKMRLNDVMVVLNKLK